MSDLTKRLLELIKNNKTLNEISDELKMSNKQLYNLFTIIKNKGIEFNRIYYEDGNIKYNENKELYTNNLNNSITIKTNSNNNIFKAVVTSDLHIGNSAQRLDLLYKLYDYCSKESIHNVFITGDLIDGTYNRMPQIMTLEEQIDFIIKKYPFDKNILNFVVLGDHDYSSLDSTGQNIATVLNNYRQDIVPIGYNLGKINIKKDQVILYHKFNDKYKNQVNYTLPTQNSIIFHGHHHNGFSVNKSCSNTIIYIPTLSDIYSDRKNSIPSAILVELIFNQEICTYIKLKQLLISNDVFPINELYLQTNSSIKNRSSNTYTTYTKK